MRKDSRLFRIAILVLIISFFTNQHAYSAPQSFSGTEDNIVDISPIKSASIIRFSYSGEGVFTVSPVDGSGKEGLPYQLDIGDASGIYFQEAPKKPIVALAVKGTGEWKIEVDELKNAPMSSSKTGAGSGSSVVKIAKATSGIKRITWAHSGEGVFSVTPIDSKGRAKFPLFLKIGTYNGTVSLPSGTQYFAIKADGDWKYSIK
jgi:hypothetical protein